MRAVRPHQAADPLRCVGRAHPATPRIVAPTYRPRSSPLGRSVEARPILGAAGLAQPATQSSTECGFDKVMMASQTGYDDAGGFGEGIPPDLRSRDLPSKRLLGKGLASIGYETEWKGERYARTDFAGVPSDIFLLEAAALVRLKHVDENVVKTHGLTVDKLSCSLVLEYMDDKLSDLLQKRKDLKCIPPFELPEAVNLMLQISKGMVYLHEQGILHGDLKTRNILVTYENNGNMDLAVKLVKVADFGRGQIKKNSMSNVSRQARKLDMVRWKAPEILKESTSSESDSSLDEEWTISSGVPLRVLLSMDVYSFAVTCSQILTGEEPYPERNWEVLMDGIVFGKLRPKLPPSCPETLSKLLEQCWDSDPYKRPTFSDIRKFLDTLRTSILNESQEQNAHQLERIVEKDFDAAFSSLEPMEMVGPNSPVAKPFDADSSKMPKSDPDADRLLRKRKAVMCEYTDEPEENMFSELTSLALGRETMRQFNDPIQTDSRSDDLGSSDEFRESSLEWKHKIFLSHSAAQRDFTEQLCVDLERVHQYPFFDRRHDSLRKGKTFSPLEAMRQCRVALLVLSEEFFTRSKWPMIELNELITAQESNNQGLKIVPLYLGITRKQFCESERQLRWFKIWEEFACEDRKIDVEAWKVALRMIPLINGMEYQRVEGEVAFRKEVVEVICKFFPPHVKYVVSHVQSLEQLSEPIIRKLEEAQVSSKFKATVVGLYGMGGIGKTTISKALCNQMFGDFSGKVCYVELGRHDQLELKKRILRELTNASAMSMEYGSEQLDYLLMQRMGQEKVFLVLDNVWGTHDQVYEAKKYLRIDYHAGSMVLVTSRSIDFLEQLGIEESNCMEMPNLVEEGAMNMFLHYIGISRESIVEQSELEIVKRCVKECSFSRTTGKRATLSLDKELTFHPLALKALGNQLRSLEIKQWDKILNSKVDMFNMFKDEVYPILRTGFDSLSTDLQYVFLDLALIWVPKSRLEGSRLRFEWKWLCIIHSKSEAEMKFFMNILRRVALIDRVNDVDSLDYQIHTLYMEFAKAEANSGPFEERRFLIDREGTDEVPHELQMYPPNGLFWPCLKRLIVHKSEVESLERANLHHCKNVEVLDLDCCNELWGIDVTGMDNLTCVVATDCYRLHRWRGLEMLSNLVIFHWAGSQAPLDPGFFYTLRCLAALQILKLESLNWSEVEMFPPDLSRCRNLRELTITHLRHRWWQAEPTSVGFGKLFLPNSVMKIDFSDCPMRLGRSPIRSMMALTDLQDLNLRNCEEIKDLAGLGELTSLRKLDVGGTGIFELPYDLWKLMHLEVLNVRSCSKLTNLVCIVHATALQIVDASHCKNLRELPNDFSTLTKLEVLDVSHCQNLSRTMCSYWASELKHVRVIV